MVAKARKLILVANGGVAPKVLDPFARGGSIPLEALRLGCEAHALELNPVAYLILLCSPHDTLDLSALSQGTLALK